MTDTQETQNQPEPDKDPNPSTGRGPILGRSGKRIAIGASIVVAFLGGMVLYGAIDDRETETDQAAFISAEGRPDFAPGGGPGWHHDDEGEREHFDDDEYEGDDAYEGEDEESEGDDDGYSVPPASPGSGSQPEPMQSGQS